MKYLCPLLMVLLLASCRNTSCEQRMEQYLQSIRNNPALLTAFFSNMPKGADLDNHYSAAVYAESYIDFATEHNYWIDTVNLNVYCKRTDGPTDWPNDTLCLLKSLINTKWYEKVYDRLLTKWSVKDFQECDAEDNSCHFFNALNCFDNIAYDTAFLPQGLRELRHRAIAENLQYLEIMLQQPEFDAKASKGAELMLNYAIESRDTTKLFWALQVLDADNLFENSCNGAALKFNSSIDTLSRHLSVDKADTDFLMRYVVCVQRNMPPQAFFAKLLAAFYSVSADSSLRQILGVTLIGQENSPMALNNYWLQMAMFRFCHKKFPGVKYTIRAGELPGDEMKPEELSDHISQAVFTAGANRIGSGVDMAHELKCYTLLDRMRNNEIAVEINLTGNEFILNTASDQHPVMLYKGFGVPIVISTDAPGVLRTNLTTQYVLLAMRYKQLTYDDIKDIALNSIRYSFLDPGKKAELTKRLQLQLDDFETNLCPLREKEE